MGDKSQNTKSWSQVVENKVESRQHQHQQPRKSTQPTRRSATPNSIVYDEIEYSKNGFGVDKPLINVGTGDSSVYFGVVPNSLADAFTKVKNEVNWSEMFHKGGAVPRLVCMQGEFIRDSNGSIIAEPVYRHPADTQPPMLEWSLCIAKLRDEVSKTIGQPINHALIQWYRNGNDYISTHADKTLDIERGSLITNLSLGATRTMILRDKKGNKGNKNAESRLSQRIALVNESLFSLGWNTNLEMTHEIKQDKRDDKIKTKTELAFDGHRISITFRHVSTFQRYSDKQLYGQGAKCKTEAELDEYLNSEKQQNSDLSEEQMNKLEAEREDTDHMIQMFGEENRSPQFDWDKCYGKGFSVMNMNSATR